MDPLTLAIATIVAAFASEASAVNEVGRRAIHSDTGDFEDHYPASARGHMPDCSDYDCFYGEKVVWLGDEGEMIRVDPRYMQHISGNIFYPEKLRAVVSGITEATEPVFFHPPFGQVSLIGIDEITESLEYEEYDPGRALTTGDDELDAYLHDSEAWLEENSWDDESRLEMIEQMKQAIADAIEDESGDIGEWRATVRDGNHRAFGAILAGEPWVWMRLYDNDMQDVRAGRRADHFRSKGHRALSELLARGGF